MIPCCLLFAVAGTVASTQAQSSASGTLTVGGKAAKLTHVRALEATDWELGPNRKLVEVPVTKVVLSDTPVGDVEDDFDLGARAKEGTLHGLRLTFSKKGEVLNAEVYDKAFGTGVNKMFPSGIRFEPKASSNSVISGKITQGEPDAFASVKYAFSATFSAPVEHQPKATVEGAAAAETAAAKAAQEFLRARLANDVPKLKTLLRKEFVAMLESAEGKDGVMGLLAATYPPDEVKQLKIVRVFDFGDRAWVEGTTKRASEGKKAPTDVTYRIRMVRVNGAWKVQPM